MGDVHATNGGGAGRAWDAAHTELLSKASGSLTRAAEENGMTILSIEPNLIVGFPASKGREVPALRIESVGDHDAVILGKRNVAWPTVERFGWHLEDDHDGKPGYSQLGAARKKISEEAQAQIRIAHLDTGYDRDHITRPKNLNRELSATVKEDGTVVDHDGLTGKAGHGTGTLGILAGNQVNLPGQFFHEDLGGAPDAEIIEVKIDAGAVADVIHLATAAMASGIDYAVRHNADVISLSAGGAPSRAWADAVNNAYDSGTAIFAASGNCLTFPVFGFPISPYRTVYPAAFPRVLAVTGATATHRSYGKRGTVAALWPWNWAKAQMRGCYGPARDMQEAVAGYTPNITWARYRDQPAPHRGIEIDGGGTSCATPQVAAAAALWLAYRANELPPRNSENAWRRAEAVYSILGESTWKPAGSAEFGQGLLRANQALEKHVPDNMTPRRRARAGLRWLCLFLPFDCGSDSERAATKARSQQQLQAEMFELEAAQLIARSPKLQRLVDKLFDKELFDLDEDERPPPTFSSAEQQAKMERLANAIVDHHDCSDRLRHELKKVLGK